MYKSIGDGHRWLSVKRVVSVSSGRQAHKKKQEPYYILLRIILVVTSSHSLCNARPRDTLNSYTTIMYKNRNLRELFGGIKNL